MSLTPTVGQKASLTNRGKDKYQWKEKEFDNRKNLITNGKFSIKFSFHWSLEADIILSRACFENMSMASKFQVTNNLSRAPKKIEIVCDGKEFGNDSWVHCLFPFFQTQIPHESLFSFILSNSLFFSLPIKLWKKIAVLDFSFILNLIGIWWEEEM